MVDLFLENYRLDVSKDEASLLTFAVDDISSFATRNTSFSKSITLPGTARNNRAFGHVFEIGHANDYNPSANNVGTNFNAAAKANGRIYSNNLLASKGTIKLLRIHRIGERVEYEISIFGELTGLIQSLGNSKLEDLDFSAYDHAWTASNIQSSWNTINGSGYYYPLVDYGECSFSKHDWDIRAFRPAFYVKEYFDKIFQAAGYTYSSTFINTAFFKRLIIPNNAKELYKVNSQLVTGFRSSTKVYDTSLYTAFFIEFGNFTLNNFTQTSNHTFQYTGVNPISVTLQSRITGSYDSDDSTLFELFKNGVSISAQYASPGAGNYDITFSQTISLVNGDTLQIGASMGGSATYWTLTSDVPTTISITSAVNVQGTANPGDTLLVNDTLPKGVTQIDFLGSIAKLFNLYITDDKESERTLKIEPYTDYYSNSSSNANDWSLLLDRSKVCSVTPMSELNARYFEFKYKQDSDYYNDSYRKLYNEGYGDRIFDSGYDFAKNKETCEIIFAGSPLLGYSGEDKYMTACFKARNTSGAISEERTDTTLRILQAKKISASAWDLKDGSTVLASGLTSYGYAGHLDDPTTPTSDLNFGAPRQLYFNLANAYPSANMFNVFWSSYMAEITDKDSKLFEAYFKLDARAIEQIDFSKYIFVDNQLYRLNKIEDWNANSLDVCKATLLKVINTTY